MKQPVRKTQPSEAESFERAMRDVARLTDDRPERVPLCPHVEHTSVENRQSRSEPDRDETDGDAVYAAPGVNRREMRKLRRGEHQVRGRLDLHGVAAEDAVARVRRFIDNSRHARHRAVCIVHGRGLHSRGGVAVLRVRVREALRAHRAVLAYADAPLSDGGAGAVYVLLRR